MGPGISTNDALFREGRPFLIAGSPGLGFANSPWQFAAGIVEWDLAAVAALNQPRFGWPRMDGNLYVERHYDNDVFEMLRERKIPIHKGRPSPFTELVGALTLHEDGTLHAVQDGSAGRVRIGGVMLPPPQKSRLMGSFGLSGIVIVRPWTAAQPAAPGNRSFRRPPTHAIFLPIMTFLYLDACFYRGPKT